MTKLSTLLASLSSGPLKSVADEPHDRGLVYDLGTLNRQLDRRQVLKWFGAAGAVSLAASACGGSSADGRDAAPAVDADPGACSTIPTETEGPYPGDGTNGVNALALAGIVRSDLRSSIGDATGTATGIELTVVLTILDSATCTPLVGAAVYLWHCTHGGAYSMYSGAALNENYLRGVQVTDAAGQVTFTTVFPGCYDGRWPHMHFEVYGSLDEATVGTNKIAVSQIAMPEAAANAVYATTGYEASVSNLAATSLAADNVFGDGATLELPTISGSVAAGYQARLRVAI